MGMVVGAKGKKGQPIPQMNVTPLVDVVLVLLIIFMVVTPLLSKQFWLQLPKQEESKSDSPQENKSVVLTVDERGTFEINGAPIPKEELEGKVARYMAARPDKVVYFDAADGAPYATTVEAMDIARRGGAKTVAILTKKVVQ